MGNGLSGTGLPELEGRGGCIDQKIGKGCFDDGPRLRQLTHGLFFLLIIEISVRRSGKFAHRLALTSASLRRRGYRLSMWLLFP